LAYLDRQFKGLSKELFYAVIASICGVKTYSDPHTYFQVVGTPSTAWSTPCLWQHYCIRYICILWGSFFFRFLYDTVEMTLICCRIKLITESKQLLRLKQRQSLRKNSGACKPGSVKINSVYKRSRSFISQPLPPGKLSLRSNASDLYKLSASPSSGFHGEVRSPAHFGSRKVETAQQL